MEEKEKVALKLAKQLIELHKMGAKIEYDNEENELLEFLVEMIEKLQNEVNEYKFKVCSETISELKKKVEDCISDKCLHCRNR